VGWGIVSGDAADVKPYVEGIHRLLRSRLCANHPEQYAIKAALEVHMIIWSKYEKNFAPAATSLSNQLHAARELCVPAWSVLRLSSTEIPKATTSSLKNSWCRKLVVHGSGFGQKPGTNHIRIVFLPDEKILGKAYQSIAEFIQKRYS
jgi:alanine-synthesizing transaminase